MTTMKLSFEGGDAALAGMCAQELRKQILGELPPGMNVSTERKNPASMQFFDTILVDVVGAGLVHAILKLVEQYQRPRGVTVRIDLGGRVAVLDDVNPKSLQELYKLSADNAEEK
jgi:hypothetical protein